MEYSFQAHKVQMAARFHRVANRCLALIHTVLAATYGRRPKFVIHQLSRKQVQAPGGGGGRA